MLGDAGSRVGGGGGGGGAPRQQQRPQQSQQQSQRHAAAAAHRGEVGRVLGPQLDSRLCEQPRGQPAHLPLAADVCTPAHQRREGCLSLIGPCLKWEGEGDAHGPGRRITSMSSDLATSRKPVTLPRPWS